MSKQIDTTRNPVTSVTAWYETEGDLQEPLRYSFTQHLAVRVKTRSCWDGVIFLFLTVVGVVFIAAVIGTFAP